MDTLPTGTVTFLFTDIEGSTRLWEQNPQEARAALIRHDRLIEEVVARNNGAVVRPRGEGDSRFAVFARATDAVAAAVELQVALYAEHWPTPAPLRVRIALHTGEADLRDGDYYGSAVNRCARLRSAAHGGQILLSQATYDLVRDALPGGAVIRDLGEHRLKDLQRPERVLQLAAPGLPVDFPPLTTLDNRPNNLPMQRSPLIGREKELATVQKLLLRGDVGMLTLTGPGGVGKTRLALQVAAEVIEQFEDGVFFVNLTPVSDPDLVIPAIAQTLSIREVVNQPLAETLGNHIRDKRLLLVLDNFEGLLDAAPNVSELVSEAPGLKILVTSRAALHVYTEHQFPVPPLALPDSKNLPDLEGLSQYEAVRLFIERARAVRPDFAVTNDSAPAVAEICSRLDGLPLAIELAAARIAILSPQAMLARLQNSLKLLTGGSRDLPARQQTLRGAFEWSYELLDSAEQLLFRRLAVFVASFTLEAAEAICNPDGDLPIDVLDGVMSLAGKSLLRQVEGGSSETRFGMLSTIGEFALEKLAQSAEAEELRSRHADFFIEVLGASSTALFTFSLEVMERLRADYDNMKTALWWALEHEELDRVLGDLTTFPLFGIIQGSATETQKWLNAAAIKIRQQEELSHGSTTRSKAVLLFATGFLDFIRGDFSAARSHLVESIELYRKLGDKPGLAYALHPLGMSAQAQNDYAAARTALEESVSLFREVESSYGLGVALFSLGDVALAMGDDTEAKARYEESVKVYRQAGNIYGDTFPRTSLGRLAWLQGDYATARTLVSNALERRRKPTRNWNLAISLDSLSEIARCEGKFEEAISLADEALSSFRETDDKSGIAWSLYNLAYAKYYQKDYERSLGLFKEALALRVEQGHKEGIAVCLAGLACLAGLKGSPQRAARLYGATEALFQAYTVRLSPFDRADYEKNRDAVRSQMGDEKYTAEWNQGHALSTEQAIAFALEEN